MSTRTSRRGGKEHTPVVTPPASTSSGSRVRPPSPLSPTRVSRIEEKKQMRNLNDRLACYIERVRQQNVEITNLNTQISTIEETKNSEITTIKIRYDKELAHVRKALDDTSIDKAKITIEADKLERENRDLKTEMSAVEKKNGQLDRELNSLQAKHNSMATNYDNFERELSNLRPENARLKKKLDDAKKSLEAETLQRIDAQNKLMSSEEGYRFDNDVLQSQLDESKRTKFLEISELDGKFQEEYEAKLQAQLAELRSTYENQIQENRVEFSRIYDSKLDKLQKTLASEKSNNAGSAQELRELSTKVNGLTSRNTELEASNSALSDRLNDLIKEMERAAANFRNDMVRKDSELKSKDEQIDEMLKDYKDLMETKVALDIEIAAYGKMIEGEEARLGMSQSESPTTTPVGRGVKRKRLMEEEDVISYEFVSELTGNDKVIIEPLDNDGKYIRVLNKTDDEVNIGGWKLINVSGEVESTYKFLRGTTLAPGSTSTVYNSDEKDVEHAPPSVLIMKTGKWVIGDTNETKLVNKSGEEESVRDTKREKRVTKRTSFGGGDLYQGEDNKNCAIM